MLSNDQILLVAGGVGIVPFLEFLPSLQQRIQTDTELFTSDTATGVIDGSLVRALLPSNAKHGTEKFICIGIVVRLVWFLMFGTIIFILISTRHGKIILHVKDDSSLTCI